MDNDSWKIKFIDDCSSRNSFESAETISTTQLLYKAVINPKIELNNYTVPSSDTVNITSTDKQSGGSIFRSEEIALCQLFMQPEAAYTSVSELGETGIVQFRDLNPSVNAFHRKFVNEVRRCDEMERKLRYIETELEKDGVEMPDICNNLPRAPNPRDIINLEARLEKTENEIVELSTNTMNLKSNTMELTELKEVLEKTTGFFSEQEGAMHHSHINHDSVTNGDGVDGVGGAVFSGENNGAEKSVIGQQPAGRLGFVAGVIQRERLPGFERMLWRISRGNVFLRQAELQTKLEDPNTGDQLNKTVFVAFFQGEQLKSRIKKVCTGYHASLYPCPNGQEEREDMIRGVYTRLEDLNLVLSQTEDHRHRVLVSVAKELPVWIVMVRKMKAIYHTLNMFNMDVSKKCLIAECWVPINDLPIVRKALAEGSDSVGSTIQSFLNLIQYKEAPPTFNRTNKFTRGFQNLIDAYGIASYREVNPALYTIITFPFLFGIMFGDVGHGFIMTLFALWMVLWEKKLIEKKIKNEIWTIFFGGRYIILLMGFFSIYTGFIYNDIFSRSMNIFGTSWRVNANDSYFINGVGHELITLNPSTSDYIDSTYPFGLDPAWQLAKNKIIFLNSYKMKLSIVFGVLHMIFGVCMSVINMTYFKRSINILLEFLPQILFLVLLFAYMVFLMFYKWIVFGPKNEDMAYGPGCAPSILIMFINMMLFKSSEIPAGCNEFMFESQGYLEKTFVYIGLICIPWMLLGKPIYLWISRTRKLRAKVNGHIDIEMTSVELNLENNSTDNVVEGKTGAVAESGGGHDHDDEPMSEIFIHQAIHTIEYVLSTISHTASYLRLWALSLAHAQLSEVLWDMVLKQGLKNPSFAGGITISFYFVFWSVFTIAILVLMEGLSAFLHTLRLHWVEFMSKFYSGLGYQFTPFSFRDILESEEKSTD